jgi:hypothetical protein
VTEVQALIRAIESGETIDWRDGRFRSKAPFRNCGEHFRFTPNSGRE